MHRTTILIALALGCAAAVSCVKTTYILNPNHCSGAQDGDSFCAEQYPDGSKAFCRYGSDPCNPDVDADFDGCVAERPQDECYSPCGQGNTFADDPSCLDEETTVADASTTQSSSSGGDTETSGTTVEPETEGESSTTGPECSEDVPCSDAEAPFCVDGVCGTCDATEVPDESCMELDAGAPLCVEGACVQCTAEDASGCDGVTPLCDAEANTCVACEFHEECQDIGSPACNFVTGACFDAADVTPVNAATAGSIQTAIDGVADGAEHAIVLSGSGSTNHTVTIDGGKTIAIVSSDTNTQEVRGNSGNPTVTVTGAGTTVFLHRLELTANTDDVGISVEGSGTLYADATRVAQNSGGGITLAAGTSGFLRNCMVAGVATTSPAILNSGATLEVLFSTVGRTANFGDPALECSGGATTVRNSIIVSETNAPGTEIDCPGVSIENSAERATQTPEDWFGAGFASGNYSLTAAGQGEFTNIAIWEDGDPPFDFEGEARPNTDGAMDFAGADTVP